MCVGIFFDFPPPCPCRSSAPSRPSSLAPSLAPRVMPWTSSSWRRCSCRSWMWATGWSSHSWAPTRLSWAPPSMASLPPPSTMPWDLSSGVWERRGGGGQWAALTKIWTCLGKLVAEPWGPRPRKYPSPPTGPSKAQDVWLTFDTGLCLWGWPCYNLSPGKSKVDHLGSSESPDM